MMGEAYGDEQQDSHDEDTHFHLNKIIGLREDSDLEITELKVKRLVETLQPEQILTSDGQLHIGERDSQESLVQRQHPMDLSIPKHIRFLSLNEKYLQRCLDFVEFRGSDCVILYGQAAPCNISMRPKASKMKFLFERLEPRKNSRRNGSDLGSVAIQCPLAAGAIDVVMNTYGQWLVDSIDGKNILKSPLYNHLGASGDDSKLGRLIPCDVEETKCSELACSPSHPIITSQQKLETDIVPLGNLRPGSESLHKRLISTSTTNSMCSSQLSSSTFATISHGMLQCIWKSGIPYFLFSVDDQKEVYVANRWKVDHSYNKDLDYMYLFHSRASGQRVHENHDYVPDVVGKMKVSSSLTLCSNNTKVMETEFFLFGAEETHTEDTQSSATSLKKNKGIPKKVVDMLRTNHLFKNNSTFKFGRPKSVLEDFYWDPSKAIFHKIDSLGRASLLECSPSLELAAVVVKDHLRDNCQEATVGGWGLKFLEKNRVGPAKSSLQASISSDADEESCFRNRSDCSTSTTVLVPAGIHGGPRPKYGGPSSLTERWRSGGQCDCGGWDIGCPLRVLTNRSTQEPAVAHVDAAEESKPFDLFIEGSNQAIPTLKMMTINDDSYIIHFQSTLSALQAFSIGVAMIHTRNPTLYPKNAGKLKQQESLV